MQVPLMTEEQVVEALTYLNKHHALVMAEGRACILNEEVDPDGYHTYSLSNERDFKLRYRNKPPVAFSGSKSSYADYWLKSVDRRDYNGLDFDPSTTDDNIKNGYYNTFKGFATQYKGNDINAVQGNNDQKFWYLVEHILCGGNAEIFEYVQKWLAHIFQKPAELPGTALTILGKQGTGKSTFTDMLGMLIGQHFIDSITVNDLTGVFNSALKDRLLIVADEATWGGNKKDLGTLKKRITQTTQQITFKGFESITMKNYARLIFTSNEEYAVHLEDDDRRFVMMMASEDKMRAAQWFGELRDEMVNKGGLGHLLYRLKNIDLSNWVPQDKPKNVVGFETLFQSWDAVRKWVYESLNQGYFEVDGTVVCFDDRFSHSDIKVSAGEYTKGAHYRAFTSRAFNRAIEEIAGKSKASNGERYFKLPTLDICRKRFEETSPNMKIPWDTPSNTATSSNQSIVAGIVNG